MFLSISKALGLFHLTRTVTRGQLRILCYHGFAMQDEFAFKPLLFMRPETFSTRMEYLRQSGYPVLGLGEALALMDTGSLPAGATVITIDDGFYDFYSVALDILKRFGFKATVYVTSYYMQNQVPVFRLAVQYLFWKSTVKQMDLSDLGIAFNASWAELDDSGKTNLVQRVYLHGETLANEADRDNLIRILAQRLSVDYSALEKSRLMNLMNPEEVRKIAESGIDVQLHTHRHRLPVDKSGTIREVEENRRALAPLTTGTLNHFCYPSGIWQPEHGPWLTAAGVQSATTCDTGFNTPRTPKLALKRFLDGENITQLEFEAEMSGFLEILRYIRWRLKSSSKPSLERD